MDREITLTKGRKLCLAEEVDLPSVVIPENILKETEKGLLSFSKGDEHYEGIVYWAGKEERGSLLVSRVVVPRAASTPVSFRVEALENSRIIASLQKEGLILIAQVHTHPSLDVGNRPAEEEMGFFPYEGLFSLVVPGYGLDGLLPLTDSGVYLYHEGDFLRLSDEQVEKHFKLR